MSTSARQLRWNTLVGNPRLVVQVFAQYRKKIEGNTSEQSEMVKIGNHEFETQSDGFHYTRELLYTSFPIDDKGLMTEDYINCLAGDIGESYCNATFKKAPDFANTFGLDFITIYRVGEYHSGQYARFDMGRYRPITIYPCEDINPVEQGTICNDGVEGLRDDFADGYYDPQRLFF